MVPSSDPIPLLRTGSMEHNGTSCTMWDSQFLQKHVHKCLGQQASLTSPDPLGGRPSDRERKELGGGEDGEQAGSTLYVHPHQSKRLDTVYWEGRQQQLNPVRVACGNSCLQSWHLEVGAEARWLL